MTVEPSQGTPEPPDPESVHRGFEQRFESERVGLERRDGQLSSLRLAAFVAAFVLILSGSIGGSTVQLLLGGLSALGFLVLVGMHLRVAQALEAATLRRDVHRRHLARMSREWLDFARSGEDFVDPHHPYAWDIDLLGEGSLKQRIDVSHSVRGEQCLMSWLCAPATAEEIEARQQAVAELAPRVEFRAELEAAARTASGEDKLDGSGFIEFTALPSLFEARRWLTPVVIGLPVLSALCLLLDLSGLWPNFAWAFSLLAQLVLVFVFARPLRRAYNLATARRGSLEAFEAMLLLFEGTRFESELLLRLQARVSPEGKPPSKHLAGLRRWIGYADLRTQPLVHIFVNPLLLWDLNVLRGLERWNRRAGVHVVQWFEALGELEALASLACLLELDPSARLPEVLPSKEPLQAQDLVHPLLDAQTRVANDLALQGPSTALIVTGSNMAGKSTLLRAVGLNVALALAGGPVCASRMRVPRLRLRASMRVQDSLKEGASYFYAELNKLRMVVEDLESEPPVLFLLDELLRGTNARARHQGAKAVLLHLLARGATGLVATHDTALAALEAEHPQQLRNVHFTDTEVDGEMCFDYRLRPGIVQTSNALRLLAMAGIDVPGSAS